MACRCELRRKIKAAAIPWLPERTVYLDYNATTPVDPRVIGAFERACRRNWGNPSSLHSAGTAGWNELEELYKTAGKFFTVDPDGFMLCSGGTEAIDTAVRGLAARHKDLNLITSPVEHQALNHPLFHLKRHTPASPKGYRGRVFTLGVDKNGKISIEELESLLSSLREPFIIAYSPVNHETGAVQPVKRIFDTARKYGGWILLDAVQAASRLLPSAWAPYCDMFCISAHKIYAPKGSGLLWKNSALRISPLHFGGSQEGGIFPGTENIPGAAALSAAIMLLNKEQKEELQILDALGRDTQKILSDSGISFTLESPKDHAPGILCISLTEYPDMEKLIFGLNSKNICLSRFSACTERLNGESSILRKMGREKKRASSSIRISLGRWSKRDDIYRLAKALKNLKNN